MEDSSDSHLEWVEPPVPTRRHKNLGLTTSLPPLSTDSVKKENDVYLPILPNMSPQQRLPPPVSPRYYT